MKRLRGGFTFIELIVAVSIFAIVSVAIYSTFSTGISAWRKAEKAQNLHQDVRLALERITYDLENAVLYSEKEDFLNFVGEENKISFYSLVGAFQMLPPHSELRKIDYSLDESTHILQRTEQTFAESEQEKEEFQPEEIAREIASLTFFYCYEDEDNDPPYRWKNTWDSAQTIPQGVKIELEVGQEEKIVFSKYVFIPTGKKGKEE